MKPSQRVEEAARLCKFDRLGDTLREAVSRLEARGPAPRFVFVTDGDAGLLG
ncbi:MAG: hypothetical protein R6X02_21015 [Enhygromyxa sp.]